MTVDLATRYLGLELRNPLVASSSPLTGELDSLRRLVDAGVGAVVLPSLFQEEVEHDEIAVHGLHEHGAESFYEATSYQPDLGSYDLGPERYLRLVEEAKRELSVPVVASLNGTTAGGWLHHAKLLEEAGADAVELNVYYLATDPATAGSEVERRYLDLVAEVRGETSVPLAVKMAPFFSSPAHMARSLVEHGADGLVLFNRFMQPDIDLEHLSVSAEVVLSRSWESRLPLRWIAILKGRITASLAATTGAHSADDVLKLLLVGADTVNVASTLLEGGPDRVAALLSGVEHWLEEHDYHSVEQAKGSMSLQNAPDPEQLERTQYMQLLRSYSSKTF